MLHLTTVPRARKFLASLWEVVQSVGLQTLNLAIGVRVPASQPINPSCKLHTRCNMNEYFAALATYCFQ